MAETMVNAKFGFSATEVELTRRANMPNQGAECGIAYSRFARRACEARCGVAAKLLFIVLLLLPASRAGQTPPSGFVSAERAISEIENYIDEIQREEVAVNQALQALSLASGDPSSYSAQWLTRVAPKGAGAFPLFNNARGALASWLASIRDGSDRYPPLDEIRDRMAEWRGRVARLKDALGRAPGLEDRRNRARTRLSGLKPESSEWLAERREEDRIDEEIRATLLSAQSEAESSLKITAPISKSDRTPSPFDGPITPGPPTSLWIWTEKGSTLLGDTINAQVGLANEAGPNCKADKSYSVDLECQGCVINNPQIVIQEGTTYRQTNIRVTAPKAIVRAGSKDLKRDQVNIHGCALAKTVALVFTALPDQPLRGPADGVTRLKYDLLFLDSNGQPATNGRRKAIAIGHEGVGTIEIDDKRSGAIRSAREGFIVPADECAMRQAVFSNHVGKAIVEARFNQDAPKSLTLTFYYAFPRLDIIFMAAGAVLGFLTRFFNRRGPKVSWWKSALSSFVGFVALTAFGYYAALSWWPYGYSHILAGAFALAGGVIGMEAAKLLAKWPKGGGE